MPLPAGSCSQAPGGRDLSTTHPLPPTVLRHPSSHDAPFCPDFVRRIRQNTQRARAVLGEEQSLWGGMDEEGEAGRTFPVPLLLLFRPKPPTSHFLLPAPPEPFAYSPRSIGYSPLQSFALFPPQSILFTGCPTARSDLSPSASHIPLHSERRIPGCPTCPHLPDALPSLSYLQLPA